MEEGGGLQIKSQKEAGRMGLKGRACMAPCWCTVEFAFRCVPGLWPLLRL